MCLALAANNTATLVDIINPRPEGYGSHFVVHSFRSVHRATESSTQFFVKV